MSGAAGPDARQNATTEGLSGSAGGLPAGLAGTLPASDGDVAVLAARACQRQLQAFLLHC